MTRQQAFALLVLGVGLVTAALTWRFGWIGLLAPGLVVLTYALVVDHDEPDRRVAEEVDWSE